MEFVGAYDDDVDVDGDGDDAVAVANVGGTLKRQSFSRKREFEKARKKKYGILGVDVI